MRTKKNMHSKRIVIGYLVLYSRIYLFFFIILLRLVAHGELLGTVSKKVPKVCNQYITVQINTKLFKVYSAGSSKRLDIQHIKL